MSTKRGASVNSIKPICIKTPPHPFVVISLRSRPDLNAACVSSFPTLSTFSVHPETRKLVDCIYLRYVVCLLWHCQFQDWRAAEILTDENRRNRTLARLLWEILLYNRAVVTLVEPIDASTQTQSFHSAVSRTRRPRVLDQEIRTRTNSWRVYNIDTNSLRRSPPGYLQWYPKTRVNSFLQRMERNIDQNNLRRWAVG